VWQMLRGSMTIFSAFFSKFFLKRELFASHWIGVCVVAFALVVVAFSSLMPGVREKQNKKEESSSDMSQSSHSEVSVGKTALGCALVVLAQIIQASQIVIEEFLLKNISLNPVLIVGLEGMWGFMSCCILLVIVSFVPGALHEDTPDTLYMFFKNTRIFLVGLLYVTAILCYNLFGMFVTQYTSAVMRTILEGLRCACIWITNLFIFYVFHPDKMGEEWNDWSYLQLCGFLFLLLGMFIYNSILRIQGLYYKDADPKAKTPTEEGTTQPTIEVPTDE